MILSFKETEIYQATIVGFCRMEQIEKQMNIFIEANF